MEGEAVVLESVLPSKQTRVTDEHVAWTFKITPLVERASMKCEGSREGDRSAREPHFKHS